MARGGNWQEELEKILHACVAKNMLDDFKGCRDDEARIQFAIRHDLLRDVKWMHLVFDNCHELTGKSAEKAAQSRLDGNKLFQKKLYKYALSKYTEAVILAPATSTELALAYGNRSAVLFQTGSFRECLTDIDQAECCGYSQSSIHKLFLRRSRCLIKLGQTTQALSTIEQIENLLQSTDLDDKKKDDIQKEMKQIRASAQKLSCTVPNSEAAVQQSTTQVSYGQNDVLVQATCAVTMETSEGKGRYLVANQSIKAGDTLIIEKPYAAILLPDHYGTHCHHCIGLLEVVFPCRQCAHVRYCSPQCETDGWKQYHRTECLYLHLLHSVGIAHLSLRIILMAGLPFLKFFRVKQMVRVTKDTDGMDISDSVGGLDENGQYCRSYQTVFDLVTHSQDQEAEDLLQYALTAQLLLRILQHSNWFQQCDHLIDQHSSEPCDAVQSLSSHLSHSINIQSGCDMEANIDRSISARECHGDSVDRIDIEIDTPVYIGSLLLRHIQQLVCNAHAITKLQCTQVEGSSWMSETNQTRVATAIYPTASLMNHSCDPTIISSFNRDVLYVRAVKDVKSGEEIFNCYGPHYKRMDWSDRQHYLKQQYFFTCQCEPCVDGKEAEALFLSYRCCKCDGPVMKQLDVFACHDCHQQQNSVDPDLISKCDMLFQKGFMRLQQNNVAGAIKCLAECYSYRKRLLYKHNRQVSEVQDCLARCYATSGDFVKATQYLEESLETVEVIYGADSIEVAYELQKLSEILISAHMWNKALAVINRAVQIFTLHYGESHESVRELTAARRQLQDIL